MKWQMSNIFHSYVHGTGSNQPSIDSGTHPLDWPIYFEARRHSQTYQTPWKYVKWYWWWPSCQGCQMHLKVSRVQACCPLGGDIVDFKRARFLFSGVCRRPPDQDFTWHRAFQDNMKDAGLAAPVFVEIVRKVLSLSAALDFSFYPLSLIFF